jgi:Kdo2-lipid IVA lauroyltransferase/acyltransferase
MNLKPLIVLSIIRAFGLLNLRSARRFGRFIGWVLIKQNSRAYRVTLRNLELCYPDMNEQERLQLARESMSQSGQTLGEIGIAWAGTKEKFERNFRMIGSAENQHLFDDALAAEKGVLVLGPHLGNWEFLSSWFPVFCDMMVLYKMAKKPEIEKTMLEARLASGLKEVPGNRDGISRLVKHYEERKTIAIMPDQEPSERSGVWADFFGIPALTPKIVHYIIQQNPEGCVLFSYMLRTDTGFRIVFKAPPEEIYSEDPTISAAALNKGIEACVADAPAQYQWEYKRFKRNQDYFYRGF